MNKIRFYCLVNEASGGCLGKELIKRLIELKKNDFYEITVKPLSFTNIDEQIKEAITYDRILVAGGDGTFSFVLSRLQGFDVPVGILPLGTGNDLPKELGVYSLFSLKELEKVIQFYIKAKTKHLTIWKISYGEDLEHTKTFINYISIGFDAEVVSRFSRMRNSKIYFLNKFGKYGNRLAYVVSSFYCLKSYVDLSKLEVKSDSNEIALETKICKNFLFTNIKSILGMGISNNISSVFDQKLELIVYKSIFSYVSVLTKLSLPFFRPVLVGSFSKWELEGSVGNSSIQIDGESIYVSSKKYLIEVSGIVNVLI